MLTVEELREHVTSVLGDDALQLLLDSAYQAIAAHMGGEGDYGVVDEMVTVHGSLLPLSRRVGSITSVVECGATLTTDDYELRSSRMMLRRLRAPAWRGRVDITYIPEDDAAERDRIAVELVKLDLNHVPGVTAETVGSWSQQMAQGDRTYAAERAAILDSHVAASTAGMFR